MRKSLAWILLLAAPAQAVLTRPDRDDAEYLELAARYPAALRLEAADGEGTLIAPRWILTAERVARALVASKARRIAVHGRDHEISGLHLHPDGIALVFLGSPVNAVEPAAILREPVEEGRVVRIVGHGATGRIGNAGTAADGKARAAINTVDQVDGKRLGLRIKPHDEASDLQGALGPGDVGGPAFVEKEGRPYVAGVALGADGEWQRYARVSAFLEWIDATMLEAAVAEAAKIRKTR